MGARGVSSEHVENMEMFSGSPLRCSPVLQLRCALVLGEPCSGSRRTVLWFSENRAPVLGEPCSGSWRTVLRFSENCSPTEMFSGSPNIWIARLEPKIFVSLRWEPKLHFVGVCGEYWKTIGLGKCSHGDVYCRKWPYPCSGPIQSYPTYFILSLFRLIH